MPTDLRVLEVSFDASRGGYWVVEHGGMNRMPSGDLIVFVEAPSEIAAAGAGVAAIDAYVRDRFNNARDRVIPKVPPR